MPQAIRFDNLPLLLCCLRFSVRDTMSQKRQEMIRQRIVRVQQCLE